MVGAGWPTSRSSPAEARPHPLSHLSRCLPFAHRPPAQDSHARSLAAKHQAPVAERHHTIPPQGASGEGGGGGLHAGTRREARRARQVARSRSRRQPHASPAVQGRLQKGRRNAAAGHSERVRACVTCACSLESPSAPAAGAARAADQGRGGDEWTVDNVNF